MKRNDYKVVATKIDLQSYAMLQAIADKSGLKPYKLLQLVVNAYMRYFAKESLITDSIKSVVSSFFNLTDLKESFALCHFSNINLTFSKCIALIEKNGCKQKQAILLRTPEKGESGVMVNMNSDDILQAFISSIDYRLLNQLQTIKADNKLHSLTDALRYAINSQTDKEEDDDVSEFVRSLFADNERSEYGEEINYNNAGIYKRKHRKTLC